MKKIAAVSLLIVLVIAGMLLFRHLRQAHRQPQQMKLSGNVEAHESLIGFKVSGRIVDLPIEEGGDVKQGQMLARLDNDDYRQEVSESRAALAVKNAQLKLSEAGSRIQEIQAAWQATVDAKAGLDEKEKDLQRYNALFRKDEISGQTRDQAATAVDRARADYARLQQIYDQTRQGTRQEQIAVDRAAVHQAQQSLLLSNIRLRYTTLKAPISGVVLIRQGEVGEVVAPGSPVVTLADLDHVWVRVYLPEPELGRIHLGEQVSVGTDSYPNKRYAGHIAFISSEAEFTPKNVQTEQERVTLVYRIKVNIDNSAHELKPGMPADVYIPPS